MRILILLLYAILAFGVELKFATYNVENLFDGKIDGTEYPDFKHGSWNDQRYIRKLNNISRVIKALNADIIALNEIENEGVLKNLAIKSGYKFYKFATNKRSPVGLGFLSKRPIINSKKFIIPNVKTRPILMVEIQFNGENIKFFTAHFPARKNGIQNRKIAANTLIKLVKNERRTIVLGDMNSAYGYSFLLNDLQNNFKNLWDFIGNRDRRSFIKGGAIDHILISKDFFANSSDIGFKMGSFGSFKPSFIMNGKNRDYSDHYAIKGIITTHKNDISSAYALPPLKNINDAYKLSDKPSRVDGFVVFKDKFGYVLADKTRRGIYIYDRTAKVKVGDRLDITIQNTEIYKENLEVSNLIYNKITDSQNDDLSKFMLRPNEIRIARSGDTISNLVLNIKNGYANINEEKIKIYRPSKKLRDGNHKFSRAIFWIYKGKKELIVE